MASRRKLIVLYGVALAIIALLAILPLVAAVGSSLIAETAGCALDEGSVHSCIILGNEAGETLYAFFVMGWLALVSFPAGALAFFALLASLTLHLFLRRRRRNLPYD